MDERNHQHQEGIKQLRQDAIDKKVLELCLCSETVERLIFEFSDSITKAFISGNVEIESIIDAALKREATRLIDEQRKNDEGDYCD